MRIPKVYLETTIFNYYFDVERDAHADTVKLFEEVKAGKYQVFTSIYAVNEIMQAPDEKRDKMTALIEEYTITMLDSREEIGTNLFASRGYPFIKHCGLVAYNHGCCL